MPRDNSNEETELFRRWKGEQANLPAGLPRAEKRTGFSAPADAAPEKIKHKKTDTKKKSRLRVPIYIISAVILVCIGVLIGSYSAPNGSGTLDPLGNISVGVNTAVDSSNPIPDLAEQCMDSVVSVTTYRAGEKNGRGSGFVLTQNGYIATNFHVVSSGDDIEVEFNNGKKLTAQYIGGEAVADVALIKVDAEGLAPIAIADSSALRAGEQVFAIGDPQGMGVNLSRSVTVGYVSSPLREITYNDETQEFIQTDTALNPGNSGGPLINTSGQVVGMVTLKSLVSTMDSNGNVINADGISFAIPVNRVVELVKQAYNNYDSIEFKPGLGLYYVAVTDDIRSEADDDDMPDGLYIAGFMGGSNAASAGLKKGDVITQINGIATTDEKTVSEVIGKSSEGDVLKCTVWRDGDTLEIDITVGNYNRMREVL